jgi:AraC-like DNA-binding protein
MRLIAALFSAAFPSTSLPPASSQAMDAATAAYDVGYESPSQFSREYRRLFGSPPLA